MHQQSSDVRLTHVCIAESTQSVIDVKPWLESSPVFVDQTATAQPSNSRDGKKTLLPQSRAQEEDEPPQSTNFNDRVAPGIKLEENSDSEEEFPAARAAGVSSAIRRGESTGLRVGLPHQDNSPHEEGKQLADAQEQPFNEAVPRTSSDSLTIRIFSDLSCRRPTKNPPDEKISFRTCNGHRHNYRQ